MRNKRDVFPNRYSTMWFETIGAPTHIFDPEQKICLPNPDFKGDLYNLFCTEYCGQNHSQMVARIAVLSEDDYQAWLTKQLDTSGIGLRDLGEILYAAKGCNACHSVDGSGGTGPSWTETWANAPRPAWTDPNSEEADYGLGVRDSDLAKLNYIRHSILNPAEFYVPGYEGAAMPSYQGQLTDREIRAIATYMKSLDPALRAEAEAESEEEMRLQQEAAANAEAGGN
jgi:cytochrome c oxidase subunit 2